MKEWINKHKGEILVGVVVFFITSTISFVINWIRFAAPVAGKSAFAFLRDQIYYNAARQSSYSLINFIATTFYVFFFSYIIRSLLGLYKDIQRTIDLENIELIEKTIQAQGERELNDNDITRINKDLRKYKKKYGSKLSPSSRRIKASLIVLSVFLLLIIIYVVVYIIIPSYLWQSFELTVTRVSPYIDEHEVKMLQSQWVSMKTVEDFNAIDQRLWDIRGQFGLIP